jgi:FkbH-like protein
MSGQRFRVSRYLQRLTLEAGRVVVAHPFQMNLAVVDADIAACLALFEEPLSYEDLRERLDADEETVRGLFDFLAVERYIVAIEEDEEASLRAAIAKSHPVPPDNDTSIMHQRKEGIAASYRASSFSSRWGSPSPEAVDLSVLILGDRFARSSVELFREAARAYGFRARVSSGSSDELARSADEDAQLVAFDPGALPSISRLLDDPRLLEDAESSARLEAIRHVLGASLAALLPKSGDRLLLVHGVSAPQLPLHGRLEARLTYDTQRIIYEINAYIRSELKDVPDALFVDEERLFARYGKSRLLDDVLAPSSQRSPLGWVRAREMAGADRRRLFEGGDGHDAIRLVVREYLDCYVLWRGIGRIKCVVVDLDDTLWPGTLGDTGFTLDDFAANDTFALGPHGGLHQALKALKARGVMLAVASKNDLEGVLEQWYALSRAAEGWGLKHVLVPDDFVLLKIDWGRKSESIGAIAAELGIATDSILFIDDNPVEREEVRAAHPDVRVLGGDLNLVRTWLLDDPALQVHTLSKEAASRSEMMKAQLERDRGLRGATDEASFLRGLQIRMRVKRVHADRPLDRILELLQRTNQFNTTLVRYDAGTLARLLETPEGEAYALEVVDRFTDYGVVAVVVFEADHVACFAMSCRVIGLKVAVPFLVTAIRCAKRAHPGLEGHIVVAPRNEPCRTLFLEAGFEDLGGGRSVLRASDALVHVDPSTYAVDVSD